jgi:hypothetical protein
MAIPVLAALKAVFSLLGLLDIIAGWIEKAQMRATIRAEDANEEFKQVAERIREDKDLVFKIRSGSLALLARLRRRYTSSGS